MYSRILVPVDLKHTERLGKALRVAAELARSLGAELHVVGVTMPSPSAVAGNLGEYKEKLSAFAAQQSSDLGVSIEPHVEISHDISVDLDAVLERAADKIGADLIVMASHVPGFAEHIFASNAGYLASHASISVFVVR